MNTPAGAGLSVTRLFIDPALSAAPCITAVIRQIGFVITDDISDADVYVGERPVEQKLSLCAGSTFGVNGRVGTFDRALILSLWHYGRAAQRVDCLGKSFTVHADYQNKSNTLRLCAITLFRLLSSNGYDARFLWWFPNGARGAVNYRVDVDDGAERSLDKVAKILESHASWCSIYYCTSHFVKNYSIISGTQRAGAEVGSHCHYHYTFERDPITNKKNSQKSIRFLRENGIDVRGLVMPSGKSFPGIGNVLCDNSLSYTSNFGFIFDALPIEVRHGSVSHLEVPIHPVAPGNVIKASPSLAGLDDYLKSYYMATAIRLTEAFLPVFFYGHNNDTMHLALLPGLLDMLAVALPDHAFVRLDEYAAFWRGRLNRLVNWRQPHDGGNVAIIRHQAPDEVHVRGAARDHTWPLSLDTLFQSPLAFSGEGMRKPRLRDRLADRYELETVLPVSALSLKSYQGWKSAGYKVARRFIRALFR